MADRMRKGWVVRRRKGTHSYYLMADLKTTSSSIVAAHVFADEAEATKEAELWGAVYSVWTSPWRTNPVVVEVTWAPPIEVSKRSKR